VGGLSNTHQMCTVADPEGVQGGQTPALLIGVPFLKCSKHVNAVTVSINISRNA